MVRSFNITRQLLHGFRVLGAENDKVLNVKLSRELAEGLRQQGNNVRYHELPDVGHTNVLRGVGFRETIQRFFLNF